MTKRCTITLIAGLVTLLVVTPAALASAGPLLSGYSGPGQGSQAILGSALVNGPPPSGGARSVGAGPSANATGATAPASRDRTAVGAGGKGRKHVQGQRPRPVAGAQGAYRATSAGGAGTSDTLGLSGRDLLYILLAVGVLTFAGLSTRWLTRGPGRQSTNS